MRNRHEIFWKAGTPRGREHVQMGMHKYFYIFTSKYSCPQHMIFIRNFHQKEINQDGNDNS